MSPPANKLEKYAYIVAAQTHRNAHTRSIPWSLSLSLVKIFSYTCKLLLNVQVTILGLVWWHTFCWPWTILPYMVKPPHSYKLYYSMNILVWRGFGICLKKIALKGIHLCSRKMKSDKAITHTRQVCTITTLCTAKNQPSKTRKKSKKLGI